MFKAAAQTHPSLMDPEEAKAVTIPMAILASKDEDPAVRLSSSERFCGRENVANQDIASSQVIEAFAGNLQHEHLVEAFSDQVHGWMASK